MDITPSLPITTLSAYRYIKRVALVCLLLVGLDAVEALAQQRPSQRSSRGREFRLAFLPNIHESDGERSVPNNDSVFIFITSDVPTGGVIRYRNRAGELRTQNFQIANPAQIFTFGLPFEGIELDGFNRNGQVNRFAQGERVGTQTFHITATSDVTVYGLNQGYLTSDAFLALPVNALGREYRIMAYSSDGQGVAFRPTEPASSTPSQFAVIATEDNTTVRIRPSAPTFVSRTTNEQRVTLNAGEVYLVQADVRVQDGQADLTGSHVIADKPVAVFGSHQRALLPIQFRGGGSNQLATRDHLVEQLPGIETWGREAALTPYARPSGNESAVGTDLFRVLAAFDGTRVSINGELVRTLNAGEFYEGQLTAAGYVTASNQILVAQYKKTSSSGTNRFNGDPFMMIIPTREQYDTAYRFINVVARDRGLPAATGSQVFQEHYVTVVVPTNGASGIRIDNQLVPASAFQRVPNSDLSFANIRLSEGVHTARGDSAFAIYVYGYGFLNSYGYIGGGQLRVLSPDREPPVIAGRDTCFGFRGTVYDTVLTDSRIRLVNFEQTTLANVTATRQDFTPFADSVQFQLRLTNPLQDGSITVVAQDSIGFVSRRTIRLFGLTVGAVGQGVSPQPLERSVTINTGRSRTFPVVITNYGSTTQSVSLALDHQCQDIIRTSLEFGELGSGDGATLRVLPPQTSTTVNVRVDALQDGQCTMRLSLQTSCGVRQLVHFTLRIGQDNAPPSITSQRNDCERTVLLTVQDSEPFPAGLASVEVEANSLVNCTVNIEPLRVSSVATSSAGYTPFSRVTVSVANPRLDALYSLRVRDSAGNERLIRDTIQGFTLRLQPEGTRIDTVGRFGNHLITSFICRTFSYRNVGLLPFFIPLWSPQGNEYFSLPVSQFPAVIAPGETRAFTICFAPLQAREYRDTLRIERFCVEDTFVLTGTGLPLVRTDNTRCNVEVVLTTSSAPLKYFMQQNFPNPASTLTSVLFGFQEPVHATLTLYNALGAKVVTLAESAFSAGEFMMQIDVSRLERGVYFYELRATSATESGKVYRSVKPLLVVE